MKQLQKSCRIQFPEGSASWYARYASRIWSSRIRIREVFWASAERYAMYTLRIHGSRINFWELPSQIRALKHDLRFADPRSLTFSCSFLSNFSGIKGYSMANGKVDQFNHVNKGSITSLSFLSYYSFLHIEDNVYFKSGGKELCDCDLMKIYQNFFQNPVPICFKFSINLEMTILWLNFLQFKESISCKMEEIMPNLVCLRRFLFFIWFLHSRVINVVDKCSTFLMIILLRVCLFIFSVYML